MLKTGCIRRIAASHVLPMFFPRALKSHAIRLLALAAITVTTALAAESTITPMKTQPHRPKVIFLDVNETLLDLAPLKKSVAAALGGRDDLLALWFSTMLHYSLVETTKGTYHDFAEIGVAALRMVAESNHIELSKDDAEAAIVPVIRTLPAYPDVIPGLRSLKAAGIKLVSFTNSSNAGVKAQFENAGLIEIVDQRLSVEDVKAFKPALAAYRWALKQADVAPEDALFVAAHGWDIAGAQAAGIPTAFVARPGKVLYPLAAPPDHIVKDIQELAGLFTEKAGK